MSHDIFEIVRIVVVIALVVFAAALATPKGRLPLALRGLMKIMRKDLGTAGREGAHDSSDRFAASSPVDTRTDFGAARVDAVPAWKRLLAFVLVLIAAALALIIV